MRTLLLRKAFSCLVGCTLALAGCRATLSPILYTENGMHVSFPLPMAESYGQCKTGAILFSTGAMEFGNTPAQGAILDWTNGNSTPLGLPNEGAWGNYRFAQSPDCQTVLIDDSTSVYKYDVATATLAYWAEGKEPTYSPDGTVVALLRGRQDTELVVRSSSSGEERVVNLPSGLTTDGTYVGDVYWGGTGSSLILTIVPEDQTTMGSGLVLLVLGQNVTTTTIHRATGEYVSNPTMSDDGQYVAYTLTTRGDTETTDLAIFAVERACVIARQAFALPGQVYWVPGADTLLVVDGTDAEFMDVHGLLEQPDAPKSCIQP